ncbi:hypothetical protein [Microbacterium sp.]|uniref:hypothetical protein n=1 Tax=Microbacterium sp. TaxID=51671 RepID=UPI002FDFC017
MRRRLIAPIAALAAAGALLVPATASAAPTTQVVQGEVLRLVSVADWDAASSLRPGAPVRWDVAISADAPDPGIVSIGVSATGSAPLLLDVSLCARAWEAAGCPGGATVLRANWNLPRDGAEVQLAEIADDETAHVRLAITLGEDGAGGSTEVRVHARGAGETAVVGPGGGLATTGVPPTVPWVFGAGAALLLAGSMLLSIRRRAARESESAE